MKYGQLNILLFSEQQFNYDHGSPPKILIDLIDAITDKNDKEKCQWLILIDEVTVRTYSSNFSSLCLNDNFEIVVAINPISFDDAFNVIPPKDKKFIFKRLTFKHRNSLEISVFLLHFKKKMIAPGVLYSSATQLFIPAFAIPDSDDVALVESTYPALDKVRKL